MKEQWAVKLQPRDVASLGQLRRRSGLEVCEFPDAVWLRSGILDEELDAKFRALPGRRFVVLPDNQLVPSGNQVPQGHLPAGPWVPLSQWMTVQTENAAFGGKVTDKIPLKIVRGGKPDKANVLLTTASQWRTYAEGASQIRLDRLAFVMDDEHQVVVRGTPLPPQSGTRFVEDAGVATEAGWTWTPPVDSDVVRTELGLEQQDLALLHSDGTWNHIRSEDFVQASRSAVRS